MQLSNIVEAIRPLQAIINRIWKNYKFLRVSTYITGSISCLLIFRRCYVYAHRKYYNLPDGPLSLPIGILLGGNPVDIYQLNQLRIKYGCIASTTMGPYDSIIINHPDLVKKIYSDSRTLDMIPVVDIFSSSTKSWLERRKIIQSNLMSTLQTTFVSNSIQKFLKNVIFHEFDKRIQNDETIYLKPLFRPIAFNVVLQAMFGKEISSLNDPFWIKWETLRQKMMTTGALQYIIRLVMGGDNKYSRFIQTTLTGSTLQSSIEELTAFIDSFAQNKDQYNKSNNDSDIKLFSDYVEQYLSDKDIARFTRNDLLTDMMFILFAAIEPTYSALTFSLLLAAKYPNIQQELYNELHDVIDGEFQFDIHGLTKIPKLRAFVYESLRIFPPAPVGGVRQMLHDGFKIDARKYDGNIYDVPKKTVLSVNIYAIGQDPKNWIQDYDPVNNEQHKDVDMMKVHLDFWLDDKGLFTKKKSGKSFFAFHYGKRNCIGQSLAIREFIVVLAMIFTKYKVSHIDGRTDFKIDSLYAGAVNEPNIRYVRFEHRK